MGALFSQIFALLTAPQGNVVYQLVLVFSIASAMQAAFSQWKSNETPHARRTLLGLAVLLGAQVLLFVVSAFRVGAEASNPGALPVLDRAFAVISIIWISWIWAFPESKGPADIAAILLSVLVVAAAGLTLLLWLPRAAAVPFNNSIFDYFWQVVSIILLLLGAFLLVVRRVPGFVNGLTLLGLLFLGHIIHAVLPEPGNFSGVLHLAYLAAFPLLLTLGQRFEAAAKSAPAPAPSQESTGPQPSRYGAEPKAVNAFMDLASASEPQLLNRAITRSVAQSMLADLCFLVYLSSDKNQLEIASGYDLIREENLEGGILNKTSIPMLTSSIQRGRALRLPASGTASDLKGLAELLGIPSAGSILSVPILTEKKEPLGGVIVLSPYSGRAWSAEDQTYLANISSPLPPIIQRAQRGGQIDQETLKAAQDVQSAQATIHELDQRNAELSSQIEILTQQIEKDATEKDDLQTRLQYQAESEQTIQELQTRLQYQAESEQRIQELQSQLEAARSASVQTGAQVQQELNAALSETANLKAQLAEADQKMTELAKSGADRRKREQTEVIASISQELRQPMSSIIGYTDLLLGESVGLLGALQRKFIERIKASTERLGSLIDDMIQLNTLEVGLNDLKPESMDLNLIIDNALAYTSGQIREKNISMHLDLPKSVAQVNADREALQQILIHLLQNAGTATPVEGTIGLKVRTTSDNGQGYVMIQVSDSGGGIPEQDIPRVFTRLYRADNVLIQGVGDTGVGLSIAKSLTEAQHGRIWVETDPGVGATFNVMLPLVAGSPESRPQKEGQ